MQLKHTLVGALALGAYAQDRDLNATLAANNDTSSLAQLLQQYPSVATALNSATNVTLLAPSNDAVSALLNSSEASMLTSNPSLAEAILQYHVLNGTYTSTQIPEKETWIASSLTNETYTNVTGGQRVGLMRMDNGVMVKSGGGMNTTVVQADIAYTGGVIHVINDVLTLPVNLSSTAAAANLTAVSGALVNTSLVQPLEAAQNITVFAPDNAAFQAIGSVLANVSTEDLTSVLGYHVVNDTLGYSSTLTDGMMLTTQQGSQVRITIEGSNIFVDAARVVTADVLISNGVVHVIDNVLNPNNSTATPAPSATSGEAGFAGATSASEIPFTSAASSATGAATATGSGRATSTRSSGIGAMPMKTGAVGAAALFGAGAAWMNI